MLKRVRLRGFKNFPDAVIEFHPFSILIGANASGKSNIRDALRLLHAIGLGHSLGEIFGEKWMPGGELVWKGIRGGAAEACFGQGNHFSVEALLTIDPFDGPIDEPDHVRYSIEVSCPKNPEAPTIITEELFLNEEQVYKVLLHDPSDREKMLVSVVGFEGLLVVDGRKPVLHALPTVPEREDDDEAHRLLATIEVTIEQFTRWSFLDLHPEALRVPSVPGHTVIGSRGENLSAVLQLIWADEQLRQELIAWLSMLSPADVEDLTFPSFSAGRIQVALRESGGLEVSAEAASDGTLRFLGYLAALLLAKAPFAFFFEEIENGIHPLRLHLLVELLESVCKQRGIQIVASTHSPALLDYLSPWAREGLLLVYRAEGETGAQVGRVVDLPNARDIMAREQLSHLHASSWMEDSFGFSRGQTEEGS